jgi:hypothetical protein
MHRKELLVPSDLVRNIEATLAANPQYMAKPVQILHCLFDFKGWAKGQLGLDPRLSRLFKGQ